LAAAGNAVGLGNFLRFPAQAAQHGGGAFLIPYLVCFALLGVPLLWIEWAIGRHGGRFGHHSAPGMFDRLGRHPAYKYFGAIGLCSCVCVAGYYCYIESWTLAYVWHSIVGTFKAVPPDTFFPRYVGQHEASLFALPREAAFWFLLTLALNVWILSRGLAKGIELVSLLPGGGNLSDMDTKEKVTFGLDPHRAARALVARANQTGEELRDVPPGGRAERQVPWVRLVAMLALGVVAGCGVVAGLRHMRSRRNGTA